MKLIMLRMLKCQQLLAFWYLWAWSIQHLSIWKQEKYLFFKYFRFYEHLKFHAQLSWAWTKTISSLVLLLFQIWQRQNPETKRLVYVPTGASESEAENAFLSLYRCPEPEDRFRHSWCVLLHLFLHDGHHLIREVPGRGSLEGKEGRWRHLVAI